MTPRRPPPVRAGLVLVVSLVAGAAAHGAPPARFTILQRCIAQDRGPAPQHWQVWQVDYQLRWEGASGVVLTPADVSATVEGWVSNSRVPDHASPRWSTATVSGTSGLAATADVIASADEVRRCRERATLQVWDGDGPPEPPAAPANPAAKADDRDTAPAGPLLSLAPGATLRVRLRLEHQHFLYGPYDPLLGRRDLELRLGPATLRDPLPIDREHRVVQAACALAGPPADRRDNRQFVTAPDSLHLEAHIPGNQYYRFPELPVRYATKMRLSYWYLIAPGTEGECRGRVAQYRDAPTEWRSLSDGLHEDVLSVVGRWIHVERVFRTEADATTLALDFRIVGGDNDVGEMWIDDVTLEAVGADPAGP